MKHTTAFLEWVFKNYCFPDEGNFGRRNDYSECEYGVSESEMLLKHYEEALEDAKSFLDSQSLEAVRLIITHYKSMLFDNLDNIQNELKHYNT